MPVRDEYLFLVLRPELTLAIRAAPPDGWFRLGDSEYRSPDDNHLTAFYDRIVNASRRLIGIRIHPVTEVGNALPGRVGTAPYLDVGPGYVDVFLTVNVVVDAEDTGDQAFGGQIFATVDGDLAVSINLGGLLTSASDLEALREADGRWVVLETD